MQNGAKFQLILAINNITDINMNLLSYLFSLTEQREIIDVDYEDLSDQNSIKTKANEEKTESDLPLLIPEEM